MAAEGDGDRDEVGVQNRESECGLCKAACGGGQGERLAPSGDEGDDSDSDDEAWMGEGDRQGHVDAAVSERQAANRRCGLVFGMRVRRLRHASHDATWKRWREREYAGGEEGPMWWSGAAGCPAGCGCREDVDHVISGRCTATPNADEYRHEARAARVARAVMASAVRAAPAERAARSATVVTARAAVVRASTVATAARACPGPLEPGPLRASQKKGKGQWSCDDAHSNGEISDRGAGRARSALRGLGLAGYRYYEARWTGGAGCENGRLSAMPDV